MQVRLLNECDAEDYRVLSQKRCSMVRDTLMNKKWSSNLKTKSFLRRKREKTGWNGIKF